MVEQDVPGGEDRAHQEDPQLAFTVRARTFDDAEAIVRERLEANGKIVRSVSHAPDDVVVVMIRLPKNVVPAPSARR